MRRATIAILGLLASPALAGQASTPGALPGAATEEAAPSGELETLPEVVLERIPPRVSYEVGIQASFGTIAHFRDEASPWMGLGVRGGGGWHRGPHRVGGGLTVGYEGEAPLYFNLVFEPQVVWDFITRGLLVGASVGPTVLVHSELALKGSDTGLSLAPAAAVRLGWSQGWTRVGRRMFVFVEPRIRYAEGQIHPTAMVMVGSGGGR